MATENPLSPRLPYNSPPPAGKGRPRHNSTRKSSYSTPLPASIESPRTLCPRDIDAFSFSPAHLTNWSFDDALLKHLPNALKEAIAHFQRSGAAVLTGFERLEEHSGHISTFTPKPTEDEMIVQLDDSVSSLKSLPKLDTDSSFSSSYHVTSSPTSSTHSPSMSVSQGSQVSPVSPISLAADVYPDGKLSPGASLAARARERSFSTPVDPADAYYRNELSQLRTEAIPRLRHAGIKVGIEWLAVKDSGAIPKEDVDVLQRWWDERNVKVQELDEKTRRLSDLHGLTPHGLGWSD